MIFRDIKQGYPIYLFDRQSFKASQGKVVAVSVPHYDMKAPSGQMVVDIKVEADGNATEYVVLDGSSTAYSGNIMLSTDRDGIVREVEAMKEQAERVLASVDEQKHIAEQAKELLAELNPMYKERVETEKRFTSIESGMAELKAMMQDISKRLQP